jgi:choline dehydrogenase-like flavoprotein
MNGAYALLARGTPALDGCVGPSPLANDAGAQNGAGLPVAVPGHWSSPRKHGIDLALLNPDPEELALGPSSPACTFGRARRGIHSRRELARYDWNHTTTPQAVSFDDHTIPYPRGFAPGGCSSISAFLATASSGSPVLSARPDYLVYSRGSRDDLDALAAATGGPGWSWGATAEQRPPDCRRLPACRARPGQRV